MTQEAENTIGQIQSMLDANRYHSVVELYDKLEAETKDPDDPDTRERGYLLAKDHPFVWGAIRESLEFMDSAGQLPPEQTAPFITSRLALGSHLGWFDPVTSPVAARYKNYLEAKYLEPAHPGITEPEAQPAATEPPTLSPEDRKNVLDAIRLYGSIEMARHIAQMDAQSEIPLQEQLGQRMLSLLAAYEDLLAQPGSVQSEAVIKQIGKEGWQHIKTVAEQAERLRAETAEQIQTAGQERIRQAATQQPKTRRFGLPNPFRPQPSPPPVQPRARLVSEGQQPTDEDLKSKMVTEVQRLINAGVPRAEAIERVAEQFKQSSGNS